MKKASTIFDYDLSENEINALKEEFKLSSELTDAAKRISSAYDGKWVWRKGKYYEVSPEEKIDPSDGAFNLYSRTLKITIFFFSLEIMEL